MDFTLKTYNLLIKSLLASGYIILCLKENFENHPESDKVIILRHDIDKVRKSCLQMAEIESELGVKSTYCFRIEHFRKWAELIRYIHFLKHEIGYHYNELSKCRGDEQKAFKMFSANLSDARKIVPVVSMSMDGQPLKRWDNRGLWKNYDYRAEGIIGEAYLDIDYSEFAYFTDTGRAWNNTASNVRDKVRGQFYQFKSTKDIIKAIREGKFPEKAVINVHPQRWSDNFFIWVRELIFQFMKNKVKYLILKFRQENV